jgi:hypothetical protein
MRSFYIFVIPLVVCACGRRADADAGSPPPREPIYATSDTAHYGTLPDTASSVVLTRDGVAVDTIDAAFGVQHVGFDSVLFMSRASGAYKLYDGKSATNLSAIVPDFDDHYSAPSVIENAVLYWAIHRSPTMDSVRATRYEFPRRRLNPLPVNAKFDSTKGRYYFRPPFLDGKEIVFKAPDGEWRFRTPKQ